MIWVLYALLNIESTQIVKIDETNSLKSCLTKLQEHREADNNFHGFCIRKGGTVTYI